MIQYGALMPLRRACKPSASTSIAISIPPHIYLFILDFFLLFFFKFIFPTLSSSHFSMITCFSFFHLHLSIYRSSSISSAWLGSSRNYRCHCLGQNLHLPTGIVLNTVIQTMLFIQILCCNRFLLLSTNLVAGRIY